MEPTVLTIIFQQATYPDVSFCFYSLFLSRRRHCSVGLAINHVLGNFFGGHIGKIVINDIDAQSVF